MAGLLVLAMLFFVAAPGSIPFATSGTVSASAALVHAGMARSTTPDCADDMANPGKGEADHHGAASCLCVACVGVPGVNTPVLALSTPRLRGRVVHSVMPPDSSTSVEAIPALPPPRFFV